MLNTQPLKKAEDIGDDHAASSYDTPLRTDAFELSEEEKMDRIEEHFRAIMETLGMDLTDDSLRGTPRRVAKMYVQEVFSGLDPENKPAATLFENKFKYDQMVVEKDITFYSHCEHHFVPIYGKAHVAYISSGKVIGLSKINRIVQYYSKRPQVQERLTVQIAKELKTILDTEHVAVVMDANHMCVSSRGVGDTNSKTGTAYFSGRFREELTKKEFLNYINAQ
jgi:GTP cyclohydrolase I